VGVTSRKSRSTSGVNITHLFQILNIYVIMWAPFAIRCLTLPLEKNSSHDPHKPIFFCSFWTWSAHAYLVVLDWIRQPTVDLSGTVSLLAGSFHLHLWLLETAGLVSKDKLNWQKQIPFGRALFLLKWLLNLSFSSRSELFMWRFPLFIKVRFLASMVSPVHCRQSTYYHFFDCRKQEHTTKIVIPRSQTYSVWYRQTHGLI
jgi:hypothetical protein